MTFNWRPAVSGPSVAGRGEPWQTAGKCRGRDPELWFAEGFGIEAELGIAEAKALCAVCPVRETCAVDALESGEVWGIRGGYTADERRHILAADSWRDGLPPIKHPACPNGHRSLGNLKRRGGKERHCVACEHLERKESARSWVAGRREQIADLIQRAQAAEPPKQCSRGHWQTTENTYAQRGGTRCRLCAADGQRAYRERQAERVSA